MQNLQKPDSFSFLKKRNYYDDAGLRVEKIFSEDVTHGTQIPCVEWSPEGKLQCNEVFCFQSHSSQTHPHTCAAVPTSKLLLQSCICFPEKIFSSCFKWSFSICSSVLHFWDILHLNISGYKIIKIRHHIEEKKHPCVLNNWQSNFYRFVRSLLQSDLTELFCRATKS